MSQEQTRAHTSERSNDMDTRRDAQTGPVTHPNAGDVVAAPEERVAPLYMEDGTGGTGTPHPSAAGPTSEAHMQNAALFSETDAGALHQQWEGIQASFVNEPRRAVQEADQLVQETIGRLTESFSQERSRMEQQWSRGDDVSTEELRVALQRYRSFFQRLLSV
jgi:hypothetical protein